jgi:phosphate transport system protein
MRSAFQEQLGSLTEALSQMCGLAGLAMERATEALLQARHVWAHHAGGADT